MNAASAAPALIPQGHMPNPDTAQPMDRRLLIVIAVIGLHVLGLWALQVGLLQRAVEQVVSVQLLADWVAAPPAQPQVAPAQPQPTQQTHPQTRPQTQPMPTTAATAPQQPQPLPDALALATPTDPAQPAGANAVVESRQPNPQPTAIGPATDAPAAATAASPTAAPKTELASNADHLNNPQPPYPKLSRDLIETGVVLLRVRVEADGRPSEVQLHKTSGYPRLDQAAIAGVQSKWRFVPAKQDGVPTPSWIIQAVRFNLKSSPNF